MEYTKAVVNPHHIIISSPDPKYAPREWFIRQQFLRERIESRGNSQLNIPMATSSS